MQETEVKFHVRDLKRLQTRLETLGAQRVQERVLERNVRFDLPGGRLRSEGRVLRLRQDTASRLTYKSASKKEQGVLSREEIEFVVEDFEKAKRFLEALGYRKSAYYEKYRTVFELNETSIMLDELPYGNFVEIEGETVEVIHGAADRLDLDWAAAAATSYLALFERVRAALQLSFQDVSFENFTGIRVDSSHLAVHPADK